jgi:hypothetical protein
LFLDCTDVILPSICKLFNNIFQSGLFPEMWSQGCIVPVYKKGDCNDTNNYRGVTLISCMGKLFTSVLNRRLLKWDKENSVISDAQFGFKPGHSTVDAIFVLQSLINRTLKKRKRLYCCFIDYRKAFDLIDRSSLWCKLINQGVQGKMLKIIKSLYENVKSCVKHNGYLSEYFSSKVGLFQGEVLSPILYSLYVNDCEMHFIRENCPSVEISMISLFLLMYADDTVLIAESAEALQSMLDALQSYNDKWNLTLNIEKTKIVVFRNGGKIRGDENWYYGGHEMQVVNEINYLEMLLYYTGKFRKTQMHAAEQGRKALFALSNKLKNHSFNVETQCSVFDTYVASILCYGSEIWGFHKAPDVEKVHSRFCKNVLKVKKSTCNDLLYCELGRLPLAVIRKLKIIKYWMKLRQTDNCILKECLKQMLLDNDDWIVNIKNVLYTMGLGFIWENEHIDKCMYTIVEQRIRDTHKQEIMSRISSISRGEIYQHLIDNFCLQYYLTKHINPVYKMYITRFRLSSHNLNIEQGRYVNVIRERRLCTMCNCNDVEDEFHFIFKCPLYDDLRKTYIKNYYYRKPSVFKLVQLLSVNNVKELCNFGKYLYLASKRRAANL